MAKKSKYYVVWKGHHPGVYNTWARCQRETRGYTGAKFMSFDSKTEALDAFNNPGNVKPKSKKKQYYYVVWNGYTPGIYTDWNSVLKEISGFKNSIFKTFGSKKLAEKAFSEHPDKYKDGDYKKTKDLSDAELKRIGDPIELSLAVDAACNGKGDFEYQGVWTFSNDFVFKIGPYKKGSNNIGEFLALVHALAYLNGHKDQKMLEMPIYSDSRIAMGWVKAKTCRTKQAPPPDVVDLIKRAESWLKKNNYKNPVLKWETKVWGEIPADFGRK